MPLKRWTRKTQCGGCLFLLEILYADSPAVDNVEISVTKARVAAWTRKLLDEVIKLDRNHDGSFGKLKIYWQHTNSISDGVDDREATKGDIQHFCPEIFTHMLLFQISMYSNLFG